MLSAHSNKQLIVCVCITIKQEYIWVYLLPQLSCQMICSEFHQAVVFAHQKEGLIFSTSHRISESVVYCLKMIYDHFSDCELDIPVKP